MLNKPREETTMTDFAVNVKATPKAPPPTNAPGISPDSPRADAPLFEFPVLFHGMSEASAEQAKENWQTMRSAAEKLTTAVRDTYSITTKESLDYGLKVMETARANTAAALELAKALMAAKSPTEVVELTSAHARQQLQMTVEQNRQLWAAAQKIASAMLEPINRQGSAKPAERRK
jgi:phasin